MMATNVVIVGEGLITERIVQMNAFLRSHDVPDDRLRYIREPYARLQLTYSHRISVNCGFRHGLILITSRKDQHSTLSTRVLDRCAQERVDESLQNDLARDRL
jgi:hypothetical protein